MTDILIVGGGISGMLTARELRQAGAEVILLESGKIGRESSWAGGGIISPLYPWRYATEVTALASWSQAHYPRIAEQLLDDTGIDPELTVSGLLIIAPEEEQRATNWGSTNSGELTLIDQATIHEIEPALKTQAESGIWLPEVAQIRNPRLVKALHEDIQQRKIAIREACTLLDIMHDGRRTTGVLTNRGEIPADQVVICAGAWSGELLAPLGHAPEIEPVLGQMILFRGKPGDIDRITLEADRYIIPRRDGRVLFGSTLEHQGFNKRTSDEAKAELHAIAIDRFPILEECAIEHHWAGLRPGSPGGIPYIGAHPGIQGLYINAGHFRNGVVLGPASARLMADIILGRDPILPIGPYSLKTQRN